jgi:glutamate racemase
MIIVACNTATTNAIKYLRSNYELPFIGIEPAIKPATINSLTKVVGILATKGTLTSDLFLSTSQKFSNNTEIIEQIGEGLVPLIETGNFKSEEIRSLLIQYLSPMLKRNIDHLVLGCSHYPFLIPQIKKIVGDKVKIIDSGLAVAKQTKSILIKNKLLNNSNKKANHKLYSNLNPEIIEQILKTPNNYLIDHLDF